MNFIKKQFLLAVFCFFSAGFLYLFSKELSFSYFAILFGVLFVAGFVYAFLLKYNWLCRPGCADICVDAIIIPLLLATWQFFKGRASFLACVKYFFLMPFVAVIFYLPSVLWWLHATRLVRALNKKGNQPTLEFVQTAIKQGVDVNMRSLDGSTALIWAAYSNQDPRITLALLEAGADVKIRSNGDDDALIMACANLNPEIMRILLGAGAPVNEVYGEFGSSPLMVAILTSHDPMIISILLECGADVNMRRSDGFTAFLLAAISCKDPMFISTLLQAGANIEDRDMFGNSALILAARFNQNVEITKFLIESGLDINAKNKTGDTALMSAALHNSNAAVFSAIFNAGADFNARNDNGFTAFNYASCNKMLSGTDVFLKLQSISIEKTGNN